MNGGIGGTGAPHLSQLYTGDRRPQPEGNVFAWILAQAAIQRANPKPSQVRIRVWTPPPDFEQLEGKFRPLAERSSPWDRM